MSWGERHWQARAGSRWGRVRPRARLWWLLGGGGIAITAAFVAIVVFASMSAENQRKVVEGTALAPAGAHSIGEADAPVTMVVFSSFTCPACTMFALGTEPQIIEDYVKPGKVRIVHRMIAGGGEGECATEAAECAGAQGGYREYYWALYQNWVSPNRAVLTRENLKRFAVSAGLDPGAFEACLESREYALHVRHEREAAFALGVGYTPTVFINGEELVGLMGYDVYRDIIERELAKAK